MASKIDRSDNIMKQVPDLRRQLDGARNHLRTLSRELQTLQEDQPSLSKDIRKMKEDELTKALESSQQNLSDIGARITLLIEELNDFKQEEAIGTNSSILCQYASTSDGGDESVNGRANSDQQSTITSIED